MQEKIEQLENIIVRAFRSQKEQEQREVCLGLLPGEPIEGEELEREKIDEPAGA